MKTSSAKAKARNLQKLVVMKLRKHYGLDEEFGNDCYIGDIQSVPMGMSKEDILLSPKASKVVPFSVECKNQEKLNVWSALLQCETNSKGKVPLLVFKRNRSKVYACLELDELLRLLKKSGKNLPLFNGEK